MHTVTVTAMHTGCLRPADALSIAPSRMAEIERIQKPEARAQSLAGELLLCQAVAKLRPAGIPCPPVRSLLPQGKPYFPENPDFHFSITHAGTWAVLATSDVPVGIDLERIGAPRPHIVRRYCHPDEQAWFSALPESAQTDAFYRLWVLKESIVKALGTGMHRPFKTFSVRPETLRVEGLSGSAALALPAFPDADYCLGLCVLGAALRVTGVAAAGLPFV